jgi:integrase
MTTTILDDATVRELTAEGIHFDRELKGFGVRIRPAAHGSLSKTWVVQYRFKGQQKRMKLADVAKLSAERARRLATEKLAMVVLKIDPAADRKEERAAMSTTLRSVIDQYLRIKQRQLENDRRRASSLAVTRLYLTGDYFKPLHATPINAVTRAALATRLNAIVLNHSANTASRARAHLSAFYTWAMKEGIADANPVIGTNQPEGSGPRDRVLKDRELAAIWNACKDAGEYGKIVRLLLLTGCRRDEIGALRWSWLDLEQNTLTIPSTVAKNHRQHVLPLTAMMREIIASVEQMVGRDLVFGERAKTGFTQWQHFKPKLSDGCTPWQLRDLRRTLSTGMHELGVEPHIVEAILNHVGHKSGVAGTYNYARYGRQMRVALEMWSDHVASITTGGERKIVQLANTG